MRLACRCIFMLAGTIASVCAAQAQSTNDEVAGIVRERNQERGIVALGDGALGEQISHIDGSLSFYQVDRVLKGNGLDIVLARAWNHAERRSLDARTDLPFANWDLALPKIEATGYEPILYGWDGKSEAIFRRSASYTKTPPVYPSGTSSYFALTLSGWAVGTINDGYFAVSPNGEKYWLNHKHVYTGNDWVNDLGRYYPTRIEDRFGNYLIFSWVGSQLHRIDASDGRSVKLTWNAGKVSAVAIPDGGAQQVWSYSYTDALHPVLSRVTNPDMSYWEFSLSDFEKICVPGYINHSAGNRCANFSSGEWLPLVGSVRHPSGVTGNFTIQGKPLKSKVYALDPVAGGWQSVGFVPIIAVPVKERRYLGVGVDQSWSYHYGDQCPSTLIVDNPGRFETRLPDGSLRVLLFDNTWKGAHYGEVVESLDGASCLGNGAYVAQRSVKFERVAAGEPVAWVNPRGISNNPMRGVYQKGHVFPVRKQVLLQDGMRFIVENEIFDNEARPIRINRLTESQ